VISDAVFYFGEYASQVSLCKIAELVFYSNFNGVLIMRRNGTGW
jgi:hypothetical protein